MMQRMKGTLRPGRKAGVLALAVLLLTCVLMAGAVSADETWDGTTTTIPVTTSGTYSISSGSDLAWVAKEVNSGNTFHGMTLELTENIDLGNHEWTPIGSVNNAFEGIFDGKNYTISNLKITKGPENTVSNNYVGLFGHTASPSVIKNIKIQNVNVSGSLYVGGVVGMASTGKEIRNCHISGDIHINGWWYVGGIGGNGYMGVIADCSVVGEDALSEIRGIETSPGSAGHIGGIWGFRGEGSQKIINCTVKNIAISGADRTGGISGILHYGNAIEKCTVTGVTVSISGDADTVGGIAGTYRTKSGYTETISECTFAGEVYKQNVLIPEGDRILGGVWDGNPYPRTEVIIRESTFNGIFVDDRPAKIDDFYYDTLEAALDAAEDGDTVTLLHDVSLTNALTIDEAITLTATDSVDKPTLTVPQVLIAAPNVKLDNLKIQQTEGTNPLFYTIQVTAQGDVGQITVTDSEIIPVTEGRGFSNNAGAAFDITFTGNIVKAANDEDGLAYAIYINGYNNKYVFQKNIIGSCSVSQFGFDQYVDALDRPVDISKNYWGGSEPSIELYVGAVLGEPDLTGQDTYYTELKDDGTIDESSLVSPVEPTPQPPTPVPPSYSSGSGNMDNAYRVLFNDGSTTLSVVTDLSSGDKLTKPETPVKDGYTFAGWYKDSACTQAWDFETGIPGDMTLYAKWTAAGSSSTGTEATATPTKTATAVTTPQPTKTQTAAATTSAPQATTAAGVSPTLTQAPAPVAGALFGLLAAGVLLRRRQ